MPKTHSAKKALRVSREREMHNRRLVQNYKSSLKRLKESRGKETLMAKAFSAIDKAAKANVIHKNKAARLKSVLAKKFKIVLPTKIEKKKSPSSPKVNKK